MKAFNWLFLLNCLIIVFPSCDDDSEIVSPSTQEPELLEDSYVYMSAVPGTCGMEIMDNFFEQTWHICVHAPDANSVGVYFWMEAYDFGPEDSVSIISADGVSFDGDLFTGMTISWGAKTFSHESVLSMHFTDKPPTRNDWYGMIAAFHESKLFLDSGGSVYLEDVGVQYIHCGHYGGATHFCRPDSFLVYSGQDVVLTFEGIGSAPGPYAAMGIHAVDELGWVGQLTPESLRTKCVFCPWMWTDFKLQVSVPLSASSGTRSSVSILDLNQGLLTSFDLIVD